MKAFTTLAHDHLVPMATQRRSGMMATLAMRALMLQWKAEDAGLITASGLLPQLLRYVRSARRGSVSPRSPRGTKKAASPAAVAAAWQLFQLLLARFLPGSEPADWKGDGSSPSLCSALLGGLRKLLISAVGMTRLVSLVRQLSDGEEVAADAEEVDGDAVGELPPPPPSGGLKMSRVTSAVVQMVQMTTLLRKSDPRECRPLCCTGATRRAARAPQCAWCRCGGDGAVAGLLARRLTAPQSVGR